ncbi:fibronectin type III domain-containing protein [Natronoflexus pectinivorans]|nr:fibronectin type III domain-containing protein [Natronoflexus pectinivorans]
MKDKINKPALYAIIYAFISLLSTAESRANSNLDAPVLTLDAEMVWVNEFRVSWEAVNGATHYRIWVIDTEAEDQSTYLPLYSGKIIKANHAWVINLNPNSDYQCFIRAYNDNDKSVNSNIVQVRTKSPNIEPPVLEAATNITGTSFDVSWSSVEGTVVVYKLLVSDDDFHTLVPGFDSEYRPVTSITVSGLNPLTTYKYKVKAKDIAGENESSFSTTHNTTTLLHPPVALEATNIKHDRFTANWTSVVNTTGYNLWVVYNEQPLEGYWPFAVSDTTHTITGLESEKTYTYVVTSVAGAHSSDFSNAIEVTTIHETTPPPVALEATHISSAWFVINWEEVENADHYKIYISTDNFTSHVVDYEGVVAHGDHYPFDNLNFMFDEAQAETDYQYKLTSVSNGYESEFSNIINVSTTSKPDIPEIPVALSAVKVTSQSFVAHWEEAKDGIFYRVFVSDDDFETHLSGYGGIPVWWELTLKVEGLEPGKTYQYRIQASNETGRSDYSNIIEVTTESTGTSINPVAAAHISIYPSPAQNHISLEGLETNSTIDIYSITGAKMMRLDNQSGRANLDVSALVNGMYIIRINSEKGVVSRKIFINK